MIGIGRLIEGEYWIVELLGYKVEFNNCMWIFGDKWFLEV